MSSLNPFLASIMPPAAYREHLPAATLSRLEASHREEESQRGATAVANQDDDTVVALTEGNEAVVVTSTVPTPVCVCVVPDADNL